MHRRPLGRGRLLAALAALVIIVGCILPWWRLGGEEGLPPTTGNAFDGAGIIPFFVALAVLALLTLPYASDRPVGIDRTLSYVALVVVGWIGLVLKAIDLASAGAIALPDRAPGMWIAALGLVLLSRAVYDIRREPSWR